MYERVELHVRTVRVELYVPNGKYELRVRTSTYSTLASEAGWFPLQAVPAVGVMRLDIAHPS